MSFRIIDAFMVDFKEKKDVVENKAVYNNTRPGPSY